MTQHRYRSIRGLVWGAFLLCVFVLLPFGSTHAAADDAPWEPSVSFGILSHVQYVKGDARNSFPPRTDFASQVDDRNIVVIPAIPIDFQLLAPAIDAIPGAPRLHLSAGVQFPLDNDQTLARQGTIPNPVILPPTPESPVGEDGISGQGTLFEAEFNVAWRLGLGLQFEMPVQDRRVFIQGSLDYLGQSVSLEGEVVHVTGLGDGGRSPFLVQELHTRETHAQHSLGPRLAIETHVGRAGPIGFSAFAEASALFLVAGDSQETTARDATDSAEFDYDAEPWIIQAGVGIRLRWLGD